MIACDLQDQARFRPDSELMSAPLFDPVTDFYERADPAKSN